MSYNYNVLRSVLTWRKKTRNEESVQNHFSSFKVFAMTLLLFALGTMQSVSQTVLINPATDGGFENGSTLVANGWTAVNASTDGWVVGSAPTAATGTNCGYVSANGGGAWTYSQISTFTHIYKDVTIPAGENKVTLTFKWKALGEGTTTTDWDNMKIWLAPTTVTPTTTAQVSGATQLSGPGAISGMYKLNSASWNTETIVFSGTPGITYRLIFSWKSDSADIVNPPAALDDISLVSQAPGLFTSIVTGNWSSATTWDANAVPTLLDNVIVSTGHTVTIDAANQAANNLTVNGTLTYGTTPSSFAVSNNLTVNSGGLFNVFNGTTGKTVTVAGNIVNDGTIDISVGTTTAGNLTLNGTSVQSVSGSGTFNTGVIRNITFSNTNTSTPNINWLVNNIKVANNLNITGARINLGTNKLTFGNSAAGGTLTAPVGTGFLPGGKFSRWWTATAIGSSITAGTDPTTATSRYPFINTNGYNRAMYITRTNATGAVAGELAVVYTDASTITTGLSIADGAYTITDRYNGNWAVSNEGTPVSASSYTVVLFAQNGMYPSNGNARVMKASAALSGTHQNGTTTPGAQRITVTQADLLAEPLYIGIAAADVPFVSVANGDWNNAATWNKGTVPTCTDAVTIAAGTNVTVNTASNVSKSITIAISGTLTVASGDLTVGCTLNNNPLTNNGTLTVSGGTLNINGNLMNNAGSTFNQSGGNIVVDGSDGTIANSVLTGTPLVRVTASAVSNLNLTGGTLTIVDPHYGTSTTDYALSISQGGAGNAASTNHTVKFGNGTSTTAGGNTNGFYCYLFPGSFYYSLGNVTVDALSGTNRFVKTTSIFGILGDLTVTSGEYQIASQNIVAGNVVNNGTITTTSLLALGTWTNGVYTTSANAQSISGTGVFQNLSTGSTASVTNLQINNSNTTGVTLNVPLSVSGTLTLTQGFVNTTTANILTLGTATAAGTLSGGSATSYVKGPFSRTIASANANTNYVHYPVGKVAYAPVWLAPATTAVSVMKAEAFDANAGTVDGSIINLSTARRWEAPLVSGTITDINVRLGDASIASTNIPVQAPSASGIYTSAFGSVATYTAGTPNTTQSNTVATAANYTGFLSYADSNACSGTPSPGNTLASANTICLGASVTLSLQNTTSGSGVTYAWESSTDGIAYSAISGATNPTLTVTPTAATYYRCKVTCSSNTGTSTAVQVTFANNIVTTTPASRCGTGTVTLAATASSGSTIKWYDVATGGISLASGASFTTPSVGATTTYYAAAESATAGSASLGTGVTTTGTNLSAFNNYRASAKYQMIYTASELLAIGLSAGNITSIAYNITSLGSAATNANYTVKMGSTTLTTFANTTFATPAFTTCYGPSTYTHTASGWQTITFTTPYNWDGTSNIIIEVSHDGIDSSASANTLYTATTGNTVLYSYNGANNTLSVNRFNTMFNGQVVCSSPRVPVVATVTTPPAFALSGNSATICSGSTSTPAITIATGAADYLTYTWNPATGVSGNATTGWTFNPTVTTNYTLTASQAPQNIVANGDFSNGLTGWSNFVANWIPVNASFTATNNEGNITGITGAGGQPWFVQLNQIFTPAQIASLQVGSSYKITFSARSSVNNRSLKVFFGEDGGGFVPLHEQVYSISNTNANYETTVFNVGQTFGGMKLGFEMGLMNDDVFIDNVTLTKVVSSICNTTASVTVTVNPTPTAVTIAPTSVSTCANTIQSLVATGGTLSNVSIFNENFNGATNSWVTTNNSTGGTPANSAWTLRPNNYLYASTTFTSNDASQFYLTNGDSQGSGGTNSTLLESPAFSTVGFTDASLSFYQYYRANSGSAKVQYSTDGTTWTDLTSYTATDGAPAAFVQKTIALPAGALNQASVKIRFNYADTYGWYWAVDNVSLSGTQAMPIIWSPTTNLYTDAAATTPYTGTAASTVYFKSSTVGGPITYTATATTAIGCAAVATVPVTVNNCNIDWANFQWPGTGLIYTCNSYSVYAQVYKSGVTEAPGAGTGIKAWIGYSTTNSDPSTWTESNWNLATFNVQSGNNDEFTYTLSGLTAGTYYIASRFQYETGSYYYGGFNASGGGAWNGTSNVNASLTVNPVLAPTASAQTFCNTGTVADLVATGTGLQWYAAATGGTALASTTALATGTYYVSQTLNSCESTRTSVAVTLNVTTAPTGAATQSFCGTASMADLVVVGTNVKWYNDPVAGTEYPASLLSLIGLVNGTTYYASQTLNGCASATRLAVTANVTPVPSAPNASAQTLCSGATVANLIPSGSGLNWYASATATTPLAPTTVLTSTTYYVSQTTNTCESARTSVAVTITTATTPTGNATQNVVGNVAADATIEDLVVTGTNVVWYPTATDAANGTNAIAAGTQLVNGNTYYAVSVVGTCRSSAFAVTVTVTLGNEDFDLVSLKYYPNPVSDIITVSYSNVISSLEVYNLLGQKVKSVRSNETTVTLDMTELPSATYLLKVVSEEKSTMIKVVKK